MANDEEKQVQESSGRHRSPAYPVIDLQVALERARQIFDNEGRNSVPLAILLSRWGYKVGSGLGARTVAALKQFGLALDEGSGAQRRVRLSPCGYRILADKRPASTERDSLVKEAALMPRIHKELWTRYDGRLPPDESLVYELSVEGSFATEAAEDLVREFRKTIAFAQLDESDTRSTEGTSGIDWEDSPEPINAAPTASPSGQVARGESPGRGDEPATDILLAPGVRVSIRASAFLTEDDWQRLFTILQAMKPGFVHAPKALAQPADGGEGN